MSSLREFVAWVRSFRDFLVKWPRNGFRSPAPQMVKRSLFKRYSGQGTTWLETGTHFGRTTKFLAKHNLRVITIEPVHFLANHAKGRFRKQAKIEVIEGDSESVFEAAILRMTGDVAFWLDGHFSGGITHRGELVTPVAFELQAIEKCLKKFDTVTVLVDDFRLFQTASSDAGEYPLKDYLITWANNNGMVWTVEHDIFIASSGSI
jgi:hypothetical protein